MKADKRYGGRAALLAMLSLTLVLLSGCVSQMTQRELEDLSQTAIVPGVQAPTQDAFADGEETVTLYFLSEDGGSLYPVARQVSVPGGMGREEAALRALLCGPLEEESGAFWPDLGGEYALEQMERSGNVAIVDLRARARALAPEQLYAVRLAIANTLTEFSDIAYVNVLVGGREEGLDLGATLPVGTFSRVEDMDVQARYSRLSDQRQSDTGVTMLTTLYFPTADGGHILPSVRSVAYAEVSSIEYLYRLLEELGKGGEDALIAAQIPAPMDYIVEMPEIVRTEDGAYRAIQIRFGEALDGALEDANLTRGAYLAMLTYTLMGFVPGVEGLQVFIGDEQVTQLSAQQTPDGEALVFEQTLAMREDFAGYLGAPRVLYVRADEEGKLAAVRYVMNQDEQENPRALLEALIDMTREDSAHAALPQGLDASDILAVSTGEREIVVNLSEAFARALLPLSEQRAKEAVYAMVNTLTQDNRTASVIFFFDGEQMQTPLGGLEMRGGFCRNPGMVVK